MAQQIVRYTTRTRTVSIYNRTVRFASHTIYTAVIELKHPHALPCYHRHNNRRDWGKLVPQLVPQQCIGPQQCIDPPTAWP